MAAADARIRDIQVRTLPGSPVGGIAEAAAMTVRVVDTDVLLKLTVTV